MRIISGTARGTVLDTPESLSVRPTLGRAREALFASLGSFEDAAVLDLFAGSGAFALEAASRGAARAVMVEKNPRQIKCINRNIEKVKRSGAAGEITLRGMNVFHGGGFGGGFDVIFADPPYEESLDDFRRILESKRFISENPGALLIWELPDRKGCAGEFLQAASEHFSQVRLRVFGGTEFLFCLLPDPDDEAEKDN